MTTRDTPLARRAVLLLHGLPPSEGREVLARLTAAEQLRLGLLLDDMVAMSVKPASELSQARSAPATQPVTHVADFRTRAAALDPSVVERCLRNCSVAMVASLLHATRWPWRDHVLDLMPQLRRTEVRDAMQSGAIVVAPAVLDVWCERLCDLALELQLHEPRSRLQPANLSLSTIWARLRRLFAWAR